MELGGGWELRHQSIRARTEQVFDTRADLRSNHDASPGVFIIQGFFVSEATPNVFVTTKHSSEAWKQDMLLSAHRPSTIAPMDLIGSKEEQQAR